jgi:hypothetical protein
LSQFGDLKDAVTQLSDRFAMVYGVQPERIIRDELFIHVEGLVKTKESDLVTNY